MFLLQKTKSFKIQACTKVGKILWENSTFVSYVNINQQDYNLALFAFVYFQWQKLNLKHKKRKAGND